MLSVANLTKTYGLQVVFDGVSFTVGEGERMGLVGRNGSGKTTLLRLITGEEEPDSGKHQHPEELRHGLSFPDVLLLESGPSSARPPWPCRASEDGTDETYKVKSILFGLGFDGRGPSTSVPRSFRAASRSGSTSPRCSSAQAGPPAPRRADQLPGYRLRPVAQAVPEGVEGRADPHHPRPGLHGQRRPPTSWPSTARAYERWRARRTSSISRSSRKKRCTKRRGSTTRGSGRSWSSSSTGSGPRRRGPARSSQG